MSVRWLMGRFLSFLALFCLAWSAGVPCLHAAETQWIRASHSQARLIVDHDVIGPDQSVKFGLQLQLQPGWHSYWINPGAAGDAPHIELVISGRTLSEQGPVQWPAPRLLREGDLSAYAYEGSVLLPQTLTLAGQGDATLKAHVDWLACAEVCVPQQGDFTLFLPSGAHAVVSAQDAALFDQAAQLRPQPSPFQAFMSSKNLLTVKGEGLSKETVQSAYFFPVKSGLIDPNATQKLHVGKGFLTLSLTEDPVSTQPLAQAEIEGVLSLTDRQGQSVSMTLKTQKEALPVPSRGHDNLALILFFAFLGGIILNAMPCVFPVLAMKSLSLVALQGAERRERQKSAFYYTIGIILSFAALGGAFLSLRLLGQSVGWGFQFQSPYFVAVMCWVLLLLALNLSDVFQIGLGKMGSVLGGLPDNVRSGKEGGGKTTRPGHDMMTGLLAVLVATPCTAPFMGVAIAAALSHSALTGLMIFALMGLGLAFPYALLANMPFLLAFLPRSGEWMVIFRHFLAFPLLASCVWLLWVGTIQTGADFVIVGAGGGVLLALAAWLYGLVQKNHMLGKNRRLNLLNYGLILLLITGTALTLIIGLPSRSTEKARIQKGDHHVLPEGWEVFSPERLQRLVQEGKPVFVDMTASWCITCLVNERVVLKTPAVLEAFRKRHVTVMVGDWTNHDETIRRYLQDHGREGVPLYIYYPPHTRSENSDRPHDFNGILLPQVLTLPEVMEVLEPVLR